MRIGVIGCGMVSHAYCGAIARAPDLELAALASRTMASADARAAQYGGVAMSVEELLATEAIDLIVVLAPPALHHSLGRRVLEAGKHLYVEKPLATSLADAADLLALAAERHLAVGYAPDTFLGEGQQRARALLDGGAIGRATGGSVAFGTVGMEGRHPEMVQAVRAGRSPRAGGALAYHVLETLIALERSCAGKHRVAVASRVDRPPAVGDDT